MLADYMAYALAIIGGASLFVGIAVFSVMGMISAWSLVRRWWNGAPNVFPK